MLEWFNYFLKNAIEIFFYLLSVIEYFLCLFSRYISTEPRHEKTCFSHMRTAKVQISLRIRAV